MVAGRCCSFLLAAGLLACVWRGALFAAGGVREISCAAPFVSAVVRVVVLRGAAEQRRLGCPACRRLLAWCWRCCLGRCRRPSLRCACVLNFVVAIACGAGVIVTQRLLEEEPLSRGRLGEDTDADRRPFRRWRASCMKDTRLMRKNARFRWSWEHGGDLISLTFRVADSPP